MASHQLENCLKWAMGLAFIHRGQVSCVVHWLEVSNHFPSTASHVCQQSPRGLLGKQARVGVYLRMGHDALPGGSCGWGTQSPLAPWQSATERGEPVRGESTGVWTQREDVKMGFKVQVNAEKTAALSSLYPSDKWQKEWPCCYQVSDKSYTQSFALA